MPADAIAPDEHPTGGASNIGMRVLKGLGVVWVIP